MRNFPDVIVFSNAFFQNVRNFPDVIRKISDTTTVLNSAPYIRRSNFRTAQRHSSLGHFPFEKNRPLIHSHRGAGLRLLTNDLNMALPHQERAAVNSSFGKRYLFPSIFLYRSYIFLNSFIWNSTKYFNVLKSIINIFSKFFSLFSNPF